jgi:hypothetical protein
MAGRRPYFRQPPACHHSLLAVAKVRAAYASILPSRPNNTNANASAMDPATKLKAHWCQKATERFERVIRSRLAPWEAGGLRKRKMPKGRLGL